MSQSLGDAINRFGFELLSLTNRADEPCGICALNVYQCLMMAAAGSAGRVLAGTRDSASLELYSQSSPTVELNCVSSAWHGIQLEINLGWQETVEQVVGATAQSIELASMNAFIETDTKGKHKGLISAEDIERCALGLITCLYFKAKWADSFSIRATVAEEPFYPFKRKPQECSTVQKTGRMQYLEDPSMEICMSPYETERSNSSVPRWKAAVFLPELQGFAAVKDILATFAKDPSSLRNALGSANHAEGPNPKVSLRLPRFTLKVHLDLREALAKLGLGPAFSPSRDFAPITHTGELMITHATHDLVIDVNEEGTEMATATIVSDNRSYEPTIHMNCNRPFIFVAFDDIKKLVLCSTMVNSVEEN